MGVGILTVGGLDAKNTTFIMDGYVCINRICTCTCIVYVDTCTCICWLFSTYIKLIVFVSGKSVLQTVLCGIACVYVCVCVRACVCVCVCVCIQMYM